MPICEMNASLVRIRMTSLKNVCDKGDNILQATKIVDATIRELHELPLAGISSNAKRNILIQLSMILTFISKRMFKDVGNSVKKIKLELYMTELMMKNRLLSHSKDMGMLSKLPNDIMDNIATRILPLNLYI